MSNSSFGMDLGIDGFGGGFSAAVAAIVSGGLVLHYNIGNAASSSVKRSDCHRPEGQQRRHSIQWTDIQQRLPVIRRFK